jgi:hypothetical protein
MRTHNQICPLVSAIQLRFKFPPDRRSSYMLENLGATKCVAKVSKGLPGCEHSGVMACGTDPATFICKKVCGGLTQCCSRTCKSPCHICQKITKPNVDVGSQPSQRLIRTYHQEHACERLLKCQHFCGLPCSTNHSCNAKCSQKCRQRCGHRKCEKPCWEPCPPCMEPCEWHCPHQSCPVVCGSVSLEKIPDLLVTRSIRIYRFVPAYPVTILANKNWHVATNALQVCILRPVHHSLL